MTINPCQKLPDIAIKRIQPLSAEDAAAVTNFFLNTHLFDCNSQKNTVRLCAYFLLKERLQVCFPHLKNVRLLYGKNGKPSLDVPFALFVNVSHSGDFVMCGIAHCEIGVDIQKKRRISDDVLTVIEPGISEKMLPYTDDSKRTHLFSRRESIIKAQGGTIFDFFAPECSQSTIVTYNVTVPDSAYVAYYSLDQSKCAVPVVI